MVKPERGIVAGAIGRQLGRPGHNVADPLHQQAVAGHPKGDPSRGGPHRQVGDGGERRTRLRARPGGIRRRHRRKQPQGVEAVAHRVIDVQHEHVSIGAAGQCRPQRGPLVHARGLALQLVPRPFQGAVITARDDPQRVVVEPLVAEERLKGGPQARLVQVAGHLRLDLHAPRRSLPRQQVARPRGQRCPVPQPLAVELGAMVALAAPHQREEVLCHAGQVVRRRPAQRVVRATVRRHPERRNPIDMGREAIAVDDHVEAVGREVLAERHPARMKHPAEPAVAVKPPAEPEVAKQCDGIRDRWAFRRIVGPVGSNQPVRPQEVLQAQGKSHCDITQERTARAT